MRKPNVIIIKVSGEELAGGSDNGEKFDDCFIDGIINDILEIKNNGVQVALVVGGGNFWRGRDAKPGMDRVKADQIGMMATVMNAVYLSAAFREKGTEAVIMTPVQMGAVTELYSRDQAEKHLDSGAVLIFAAGTGHPFFSTDTIAAIRGAELSANAVLFAKPVDGVYDSDPKTNINAKKLCYLTYGEIIKNNLTVIDITASSICREQGVKSIVFKLNAPKSIVIAATGSDEEVCRIGTIVTN